MTFFLIMNTTGDEGMVGDGGMARRRYNHVTSWTKRTHSLLYKENNVLPCLWTVY